QQFPVVHGWQNTDIVIIWAVSACGFGISVGFFGNASKLAALIMNGGLDAYLGMPRNVLLHACISASDPTAWGDIIFSLGAFLLFLHRFTWPLLAAMVGFTVLITLVATGIFNLGLRRYESGNLLGMQG